MDLVSANTIYMDDMERAEKKHVGEKVREIIGEKVKANR